VDFALNAFVEIESTNVLTFEKRGSTVLGHITCFDFCEEPSFDQEWAEPTTCCH
jgi:hypothetical protein